MLLSSIALLAATASAAHGPTDRHRQASRQAAAVPCPCASASASADAVGQASAGAVGQTSVGAVGQATTTAFLDSDAVPGGFVEKGDSGVSAQMMFLGTKDTVYILDKAENNSLQIGGHPAWGTRYDLKTHEATAMAVTSNTFCAGGLHVANGSWAVFGGNQPVTHGGVAVNDKLQNPTGKNPYLNADGGEAVRVITPCDDGTCEWAENGPDLTMTVSSPLSHGLRVLHRLPSLRNALTPRASAGTRPSRASRMALSLSSAVTSTAATSLSRSRTTRRTSTGRSGRRVRFPCSSSTTRCPSVCSP